jgi:two-component system phosphate regulon sensor histidine kinase PhoR
MRTDFVANASHELRTPLATLLGFLETLQDESAAEDRNLRTRFIDIMFKEARRMHRLVDDLISLSRIEAERFSLPRESVQLLPLVEEVRRTSNRGPQVQESVIEVQHGSLEPVVLGDRLQLLQLLQNLIGNALKYGRAGGIVTSGFEEAGPGHAADERDRPRRRHRARAPPSPHRALLPSRSEPQPGDGRTGLGLAIVKHIVGRHRGRLDIRSKVGEGTAVRVYLPRAGEALSSKSHENVTGVTRNVSSDVANPE